MVYIPSEEPTANKMVPSAAGVTDLICDDKDGCCGTLSLVAWWWF